MARDDSFLNTGMSSQATRRVQYDRVQRSKAKSTVRAKLTPHAEIILEWIKEERRRVASIEDLIMNLDTEDNARAILLAKKMHLDFLNTLTAKIQNVLREAPKEPTT